MVEIFHPSQKRYLHGVVDVPVSELNFKRPTPKNSVAILEIQSSDENDACACNSNGDMKDIKLSRGTAGKWEPVPGW